MSDRQDIYQLAVEMADRVSARRLVANGFFLTLNTALVSLLGLLYENLAEDKRAVLIFMSAVGIVVSASWFFALRSYKRLNKAKYQIIQDIEKDLPYKVFTDEWEHLKRKKTGDVDMIGWRKRWVEFKDRYTDLTNIEVVVPVCFGLIYGFVLVSVLV